MLPILGVAPRFGAEGVMPGFGILILISLLLGVGMGWLAVAAGFVGFGCRLGTVLVRLLF